MKMCRSSTVKSLDLSKTRLTHSQLTHLAAMISRTPALETLSLVAVSMSMEFAELDAGNPFIQSMQDPMCKVLRLEVSLIEYPLLFKALMAAKKNRGKGKGKGAKGLKGSKGSGSSKGWAKADSGDSREGANGSDTLCLPAVLLLGEIERKQIAPFGDVFCKVFHLHAARLGMYG